MSEHRTTPLEGVNNPRLGKGRFRMAIQSRPAAPPQGGNEPNVANTQAIFRK
jgi:hypothetical protein